MNEILEKIREVCATNLSVDGSDKDPNPEFVYILDMIEVYKKENKWASERGNGAQYLG